MGENKEAESSKSRKEHESDFTGSKKSLSARRKLVYSLNLRGKTNSEIAEYFGMSLSTVEKDLHSCRQHVRDWYSEIGSTERFRAFVDASINMENIKKDLWTLYHKEKDNMKKSNLLFKISDIVIKEIGMYKTPESYLTDFYFKQKDLTKEYLIKEKFDDLINARI